MLTETQKTDRGAPARREASAVKRLVMFFCHCIWWLLPRLAVIFSIAFVGAWGSMFHQPWDWFKGIISWTVVWAAINYYKWHTNRYDT